ncbi:MAG: dihydropteroate synthase [bacterium]|nr:dihydropteroate synthase [bacterium]
MEDFLIKNFSQNDIEKELDFVGFDEAYLKTASNKFVSNLYKIYSLTPIQAVILKQTALSCGTDCAVHRDVVTQTVEKSDVILFGTNSQIKNIIKKLYIQPFGLKILAKNLEEKLSGASKKWIGKTYIMGILNITDNSFSDGGEFFEKEKALEHFSQLLSDGADIVDIGAESTAPKSEPIPQEAELERLEPILPECRKLFPKTIISVDTRNALTAKSAIGMGADIINDVSGMMHDEKMVEVLTNSEADIVLTFDDEIKTEKTLDETIKGLMRRVELCEQNGIARNRIILDAGLGFNKTFEQNIELIKNASELCSLDFPVLYGISRKSFIQKITGLLPKETEEANISIGAYLATQGVNILRVHNVKGHKIGLNALDKVIYD